MYNKYYTFGGVTLELTGEKAWKLSDLCRPFRAEPRPADHTIHVTVGDDMPQPPEGAAHEATLYRWREGERFCLLLWGLFGHLWAVVAAPLPEAATGPLPPGRAALRRCGCPRAIGRRRPTV